MEVFNRQEVLTASLDPLFLGQGLAFGAVPIPARVIRYRQMAAVIALILMTTKGSGSACLDGAHNPQMIAGAIYEILYRQVRTDGKSPPLQGRQLFASAFRGLRRLLRFFIERTRDL